MSTSGESYVVRIYRRDPRDPGRITGLVQRAEADRNSAFHSVTELLQLLSLERAPPQTDAAALKRERQAGKNRRARARLRQKSR